MRMIPAAFATLALASAGLPQSRQTGVALADLSWQEAETAMTPSTVVVIPLGAAAVEQGPHLKLGAGERLVRHLASRVQAAASVVIAPPLTYNYFPAYAEYPGSTTLVQATARDVTVDVVQSLARHGPKRFYVLNTGGAAIRPLGDAAMLLADSGILLGWTDMRYRLASAPIRHQQRAVDGAPHADEIETSMMLAIDPSIVDMTKAVAEYGRGTGALTRKDKERDDAPGIVSKTGVLGDATLATADKGRVLIDTLVAGVLADIENLRSSPLPAAKAPLPSTPPPRPAGPDRRQPNGCTINDERAIRQVGPRFSSYWREMDPIKISALFTTDADVRHPDGTVERTSDVIRMNRAELFTRKEYRGSIHPVDLYDVRCLGPNHAVADGKWELRFADTPGKTQPAGGTPNRYSGLVTLVLSSHGDGEWSIEAWRYTVTPDQGPPPPTILKQPGFIGREQ
ncbi:MAG TPA: creatininase family protein [Vicinamibacterales bacterium]|nr:creatininase family protein [Vicinamibacterales bacterium]